MTHAERQAVYRAKQGWAGKRKDRDRKRDARKTVTESMSVTIAPPVRDAPRHVRDVRETVAVSFDELEAGPGVLEEQRARMEKYRPPALVTRQMEPRERVVAHEASENEMKAMEDLVRLVERKKVDRPAGDVETGTVEVEME